MTRRVIPGFRLSLGYAMFWLGVIVVLVVLFLPGGLFSIVDRLPGRASR